MCSVVFHATKILSCVKVKLICVPFNKTNDFVLLGAMLRRRKREILRENEKNLRFSDNFSQVEKFPSKKRPFFCRNTPPWLGVFSWSWAVV